MLLNQIHKNTPNRIVASGRVVDIRDENWALLQMYKIFTLLIYCSLSLPCSSQNLYSASGIASYYANIFDGRKTACGEIFSNKKMTAAHPFLPFGTVVKVTNSTNNRAVLVRINDRGPFVKNRLIDLSQAAADSLGMIHSGLCVVKIEEIKPSIINEKSSVLADTSVYRFPEDWIGTWSGTLKIYSPRGLDQQVAMKLYILKTDLPHRYKWTIIYDNISRNYELVVHDSAKQIYSLDERNGIDIVGTILGNRFISRSSLSGNLFESKYHLVTRER